MNNTNRKKYCKIEIQKKKKLIELVIKKGFSIKKVIKVIFYYEKASEILDINFSTGKAIVRTYKIEGRVEKKAFRERKITKINNFTSMRNGIPSDRIYSDYIENNKKILIPLKKVPVFRENNYNEPFYNINYDFFTRNFEVKSQILLNPIACEREKVGNMIFEKNGSF